MTSEVVETPMTLAQACDSPRWPRRRGGKGPSFNTLLGYVRNGVRVGGQVIRLEGTRVGVALCVTDSAIDRFIRAQSEADGLTPAEERRERTAAHRRAEEMLDAAGI